MAVEFQMPKLGLTMEEGTIIEWLVGDDAEVAEGTPVVRIETDKVETEVESSGTGRLHHIGQPGKAYACGDVIAMFLAPGESATGSRRADNERACGECSACRAQSARGPAGSCRRGGRDQNCRRAHPRLPECEAGRCRRGRRHRSNLGDRAGWPHRR